MTKNAIRNRRVAKAVERNLALSSRKIKRIPITSTPTGSEQDTGFDLPAKGIVTNVWIDVTTAEATGGTKTMSVGLLASETGGDTNGFIASASVAATGIVQPTVTATTGSNEVYLSASTYGALLADFTAGTDVATDVGTFVGKRHILNGTARSVVYDADDSDWAEFRGDIYIEYIDLD